jgi:hypothetical protein
MSQRRTNALLAVFALGVAMLLAWELLARAALRRVRTSTEFEDIFSSPLPPVSRTSLAFQALVHAPGARATFEELARHGSPSAKIYALCGLYYRDRTTFELLKKQMASTSTLVRAPVGCFHFEKTIGELVTDQAFPLERRCEMLREGPSIWFGNIVRRLTRR